MPIGPPEGFLDITNATLRTSVVGISNTGPTGELSVGSNLHVHTPASNVLQVVGNVSAHNMTLGEIRMIPAHGLENVTEVGNTTPFTVSFSNATTGLAFDDEYRDKLTKDGGHAPSLAHKSKNQIGSLLYNAKQAELKIMEGRLQGVSHKAQARQKYGW
mgnify:CR=1 FL=1